MKYNAVNTVKSKLDEIRSLNLQHADVISLGRQRNREILGAVYVAGLEIEADSELLGALHDHINGLSEIEGKPNWYAEEHSVFDNILVGALGYKATNSKRHYYGKAFVNAKAAGITDAAGFVAWVGSKDGIINASKESGRSSPRLEPEQVIETFKAQLVEPSEPDTISYSLPGDGETSDIALLLVQRVSDGESRVLKLLSEPRIVASVIKQADEAPSPAQLQRLKKEALWDINRLVLMKSKCWRGKIEPEHIEKFNAALKFLQSEPSLSGQFFDGTPEAWADPETREMNVMNTDAHPLDPARYIGNAKPFRLVPYGLKTDTPATKLGLSAIPDFERWKRCAPRRRKQA